MFARRCTFLKDEEPNKLDSRKKMGVHREAESEGGRMLGGNGEPWRGNLWPDKQKLHRNLCRNTKRCSVGEWRNGRQKPEILHRAYKRVRANKGRRA